MRVFTIHAIIFMLTLSMSASCFAFNAEEFYLCSKAGDEYRGILYWARAVVTINDYDSGSELSDSVKLKLKSKASITDANYGEPNKNIKTHFINEFKRLVQGNLPYAKEETFDTLFAEYKKSAGVKNFTADDIEGFEAFEESRRKAIYGPNPGAIYTKISISRTDFPVLYEIKTNVSGRDNLWSTDRDDFVSQKNIGYSSPQYIEAELKKMITMHLTKVGNAFKLLRSCKGK
ncbi:MAG: hypothetical protein FPO08_16695 [Geobacter sp.]|nr:MAG: hypothetical protein FPO08_16695 [Geobacter sp.]